MNVMLNNFLSTFQIKMPIVNLSPHTITILNYISIIIAIIVFLSGVYIIYTRKKYGLRIVFSSLLLLINPLINSIFN